MPKQLKFIHITKTAGTSIEDLGLKHHIKWGRFDKESFEMYDKDSLKIGNPWHIPFIFLDKEYKQKFDWFIVVRNPYDRVLSEYYCKWNNKDKYFIKTQDKTEFNKMIIEKIKRKVVPFTDTRPTLEPQHNYIDKCTKIHILKFENLKVDFDNLMKKYKLNIELDLHNNKSLGKYFIVNDFSIELIKLIN